MCRETIAPLSIDGQRVRCGKRTYYLPHNAPPKLRAAVQSAIDNGKLLDVELLNHYLIVGIYSDEAGKQKKPASQIIRRESHHSPFIYLGAYSWLCSHCGAKVYATSQPRFCVKCKGGETM